MSAGAIVVVALVAAAVAATATTAVKQATGSGEDNFNDAFGNWLKTFFVSFAANTVGGAAGAAGEGAGESMTAADTANAVKVGQAAQLGNTGANAAAGVGAGTTTASDMAMKGMEAAEMTAATTPMTTLGSQIDTSRAAKLTPAANASILVATARASNSRPRVGSPPDFLSP